MTKFLVGKRKTEIEKEEQKAELKPTAVIWICYR